MKKSFFVLMLIIVACSKDVDSSTEVNNTTQESPTEQQSDNSNNQDNTNQNSSTTTQVPFISRSERYSVINETTGYFNNQNNFLRYIKNSEQIELMIKENNCTDYWFGTIDHVSLDINKDGYLDLLSFMYHMNNCTSSGVGSVGLSPGKIMLIDNYYNGGDVKYIYDTEYQSMGGSVELNDIDNDGNLEVIMFSNNRHEYNYDNTIPVKDILIVKIENDFSISQNELPHTPFDFHDGASGDIDGDGDIDLVKIKIGQMDQNQNQWFPKTLLNNGNGSFEEINLLSNQNDLENIYPGGWNSTAYELFDLNNDGNLDLIIGMDIGNYQPITEQIPGYPPLSLDQFFGEIVILWGNSTGQFTTENKTVIPDSNYLDDVQIVLGFSFVDYDLDGDTDIIISSTQEYRGYVLNLFRNDGEKNFSDVTQEIFNESFDYGTYFYEMYHIYSIDKDGDGDFDLIPGDSHMWNHQRDPIDNLYWENVGGRFEIRKED